MSEIIINVVTFSCLLFVAVVSIKVILEIIGEDK